jgi:hypothetical protein
MSCSEEGASQIVTKVRWAGHVAYMVEKRIETWVLMEKDEGNRAVCRRRRIWENAIKISVKRTGWEDVEWINLA